MMFRVVSKLSAPHEMLSARQYPLWLPLPWPRSSIVKVYFWFEASGWCLGWFRVDKGYSLPEWAGQNKSELFDSGSEAIRVGFGWMQDGSRPGFGRLKGWLVDAKLALRGIRIGLGQVRGCCKWFSLALI